MKKNLKIAVVDDNKSNLILLSKLCKMSLEDNKINFDLQSFSSYSKLIEENKIQEYDLLILDYDVPDMNGKQFLSYYSKNNHNVPIIFATGRFEIEVKDKLLKNPNVFDILFKPFPFEIYRKAILSSLKIIHNDNA